MDFRFFDNFPYFIIIAYLIGSIPFGLILTKIFGYGDIRKIGSGNIGATNVLRTGNKLLALATLILDGLKPVIAIFIIYHRKLKYSHFYYGVVPSNGSWIYSPIPKPSCPSSSNLGHILCDVTPPFYLENFANITFLLILFLVILGHCFPIWLKFKGGKGVATGLGGLLFLAPMAGAVCCAIWVITAVTKRISSLSGLVSFAFAPLVVWIFYGYSGGIACLLITALIFYRHKDNIKRLINGTEPKIGEKKDAASKT